MRLTKSERAKLNEKLRDMREHSKVREMAEYMQHGEVSTLDHVEKVTEVCYWVNRRWKLGADEDVLLRSAFLHDFYLYDWHKPDKSHKLHGFQHPNKAIENARKYFQIREREAKCIKSHMWPLTITHVPKSREAWILCLADKHVAASETVKGFFAKRKKER